MGPRTPIMSGRRLGSSVVAPSLFVFVLLISLTTPALSTPIQKVQGIISEVGEGFLIVRLDGDTRSRKFILRWKARFVPPKLPLKGDHVVVFFKEKDEGAVIYGITYLKPSSPSLPDAPGEEREFRNE